MSYFTLTNVSSGPASLVACVNRLNGAGGIAPSPIPLIPFDLGEIEHHRIAVDEGLGGELTTVAGSQCSPWSLSSGPRVVDVGCSQ